MKFIDQSLGQLARRVPGAIRIFELHELDFCCAGYQTLRSAATAAGLDPETLVKELEALPSTADTAFFADWSQVSDADLVDHIVERYHEVHRQQLPALVRLARKVEQVHAQRPDCPLGLAALLEQVSQDLEAHMRKEEILLFPMIVSGNRRNIHLPINIMRAEHDDHGKVLRRLAALTHGMQPPADACTTWRALCSALRGFREDLMAHIHIENNILFERFARAAVC